MGGEILGALLFWLAMVAASPSWGSPPACSGDANHDGVVNILDLSLTVSNLHKGTEPYRFGDTNGDMIVTMDDLEVERLNYGNICLALPPA